MRVLSYKLLCVRLHPRCETCRPELYTRVAPSAENRTRRRTFQHTRGNEVKNLSGRNECNRNRISGTVCCSQDDRERYDHKVNFYSAP